METDMTANPVLILICGKIASGKSTLSDRLADELGAVALHEDDWLSALYGDQMTSVADYVRFAARLRGVMGPHVVALLRAGTPVVLDFPANTPEYRAWMMGLIQATGVRHEMHVLDVPDEVCWERLQRRNAHGGNPFKVTRAQFDAITRHFSLPAEAEGFHLVWHGGNKADG